MTIEVRVQEGDFDPGIELARLRVDRPAVGAIASFIGTVRDLNDVAGERATVSSLTLEHYPGMTERALEDVCSRACGRWPLIDVVVIHRHGTLQPTDQIVFVATSSSHRGAAFEACAFIMDYLKTDAPFWKKEATAAGPRWVEQRATDLVAAERWQSEDRE